MKGILAYFLISTIIFCYILPSSSYAESQTIVKVGSGSIAGVYNHFAIEFCNIINKYGHGKYKCKAIPAKGSVSNISNVYNGSIDFGICQSDQVWQAVNGEGLWNGEDKLKSIRTVFNIYLEDVVLVARKNAGIKDVYDLEGKRVNLGNHGTGYLTNAKDIIRIYDIKNIQRHYLPAGEAASALINNDIDAFFYTTGTPSKIIEDVTSSTEAILIPISSERIKEFVKKTPYYVLNKIPANTYVGNKMSIPTYAVQSMMIANTDMHETVVYDILKILIDNLSKLKESHHLFSHLTSENMANNHIVTTHPGAKKLYLKIMNINK
ncbi:MAG: TAXI family TRAP transporter solute-binding subunit [Candidatus Thiodiazotropha endolucinida]